MQMQQTTKKANNALTIASSFPAYREQFENSIDKKRFLQLTALYNKFLMAKVFDGEHISLPSRFGSLYIESHKQKLRVDEHGRTVGAGVDWPKTKALWERSEKARLNKQLVYYRNSHTDGRRFKFLWSKQTAMFTNKFLYALRPTRANKRELSALLFSGKEYAKR
jgi:hypothetical protein